jgi:rhodanese-related sulfurtransferase
VIDPDAPVVVCADNEEDCAELARRLRAVAIDGVLGAVPGGPEAFRAAGRALDRWPAVSIPDLARRLGEFSLIDVRDQDEWERGHVAASIHRPLHLLREAPALPPGQLAVGCASGERAAVAAAWLRRAGHSALRLGGSVLDLERYGIAMASR